MEGPGEQQGNVVFRRAPALRFTLALIPALLAIGLLPRAANAGADFSASKVEIAPTMPRAGDVVRYRITVLNSGSATNYVRVSTTLPSGFLINAEAIAPARPAQPSNSSGMRAVSPAARRVAACSRC